MRGSTTDNYLEDRFAKTEMWSPITSYYDLLAAPNSGLMYANTPWSGHYDVQGAMWATAHTTQFGQPGWQYLDTSSCFLRRQGSYVSLRSPNKKDWSVLLETVEALQPESIDFSVTGGLVARWYISGRRTQRTRLNTWRVFNSWVPFLVHVRSWLLIFTYDHDGLRSRNCTTTGIPAFPMPYEDDFEEIAVNRAPRYLADQDGAFEACSCGEREGRCLEQEIEQRPISWSPMPNPFSIAGSADSNDYAVAADVHLPDHGSASLMARIDSADVSKDGAAL